MREIKCRARTEFSTEELDKLGIKHENDWIYGTYLDGYIVNEVVEATNEYISLGDWFPVLENTVGQCTGLKDKNGKEIYEGDIVKAIRKEDGFYKLSQIKFMSHNFVFVFSDKIKAIYHQDIDKFDYELLIVGNVYENPELLEVSK